MSSVTGRGRRAGRVLCDRKKDTERFRKRSWKKVTKVAKTSNKVIFKMLPQGTDHLNRLQG